MPHNVFLNKFLNEISVFQEFNSTLVVFVNSLSLFLLLLLFLLLFLLLLLLLLSLFVNWSPVFAS